MKRKKTHNFKCLSCSNFFEIDDNKFKLAQKELKDGSIHPNDLKHTITCPKCGNFNLQYLPNKKNKSKEKSNKKNIFFKLFDFLGTIFGLIFGEIITLFIITWNDNKNLFLRKLFSFCGYIISVYIIINIFKIDPLHSCILFLAYRLIEKLRGSR